MSIFRLVIAWLVMAALPLQGLAAVSMQFCEQAAHSTVANAAGHDHAAHGHGAGHDDAAHSHDGDVSDKAEQAASSGGQQAEEPQVGAGLADEGHSCPICASCCNLVALSETPDLGLDGHSPTSQPLQEPSRVITRHAPTPDKPPRA